MLWYNTNTTTICWVSGNRKALNSLEKIEQEQRSLKSINDSFKKIIVVRDNIKVRRNDYGIVTMGICNFLLDENSLDL